MESMDELFDECLGKTDTAYSVDLNFDTGCETSLLENASMIESTSISLCEIEHVLSDDKVSKAPRKKDPKNAERSKQTRQRKKEKVEQERRDNVSLRKDRHNLLKRVADLELEVQGLRGSNAVNLEKENELLAAELKRYKRYVDRIVELTKAETDYPHQETLVALQTGISSSVSQVIGLTYSSLIDETWLKGEDVLLVGDILAKVWYQLLPIGLSRAESTRMNMRVDFTNIRRTSSQVTAVLKRANMDIEGIKDFYTECTLCAENTYDLVNKNKIFIIQWRQY